MLFLDFIKIPRNCSIYTKVHHFTPLSLSLPFFLAFTICALTYLVFNNVRSNRVEKITINYVSPNILFEYII